MRIKRGTVSHRKHKKLLKITSGYRMSKHRLVKVAKEAFLHAGQYAYQGRRQKKSNFRRLWISRISSAVRTRGLTYSQFSAQLKKAQIQLDRKVLANLIVTDGEAFRQIVDKVKNI
ncbi:50S ribosomal protein L20 [Candidatus Gottesmanbacteria bacterium]|nr:50S ribosomal protein L20 [Candidatus Gottesmanbacteria bacterium]